MSKKKVAETTTKKKLNREGDPDKDVAKARALDGDTGNDPADEGAGTTADRAGAEDEGDDDTPASGVSNSALASPAGHPDNEERVTEGTKLEGAQFEVVSYPHGAPNESGVVSKKHGGVITLRSSEGEEVEFVVTSEATARQIANAFGRLGDEIARRSM